MSTEAHRFAGQRAVVVGGGRGIGRATSLRLAAEGAIVAVADQAEKYAREVAAEIVADGGVAFAFGVDAVDREGVAELFVAAAAAFDGGAAPSGRPSFDVLVNCPAHASDTDFEQFTDEDFDLDMNVTLKAPFLCIQQALPYLAAARHGNVVSISSINGLAAFGNEIYGAAKAGVINLHKNLALKYGATGIRFNVVAPGTVRTRAWEQRLAERPGTFERVAANYPLGRVGEPEDIAAAVAFLASGDASWVTGTVLTVDGGVTAGNSPLIGAILGDDFFASPPTGSDS